MTFSHRLACAMAIAGIAGSAQSQVTWYVDDDNCPGPGSGTEADPFCSIQSALIAAADGDEIVVAQGSYLEMIDLAGKAVTLRSSAAPQDTVIDAQGNGTVVVGAGSAVLNGFTITGGSGPTGGGLLNSSGNPTVVACRFVNNSAVAGGALYSDAGTLTLTDCVFISNAAGSGGGLRLVGGDALLEGCSFIGNSVGLDGGGIFATHAYVELTDCFLSGNEAATGGAIEASFGVAKLNRCRLLGNAATGAGGAVFEAQNLQFELVNCEFSGNSSPSGAGLLVGTPTARLVNCTVAGNLGHGAYLDTDASAVIMANCIFWGNASGAIGGPNPAPTVTYSDVEGGWTGPGSNNIDADPRFADPDDGDLRLLPESPCIDASDNTAVPEGVTTDLDGNPRFLEIPEVADTGNGDPPIVDMGAYESLGGGCLAITNLETVCYGDGSTFTVNVEGLNACTGGTTTATFTGSGGAVGADFCATLIINTEEGGFCCSTQVCVPVPDCAPPAAVGDIDGNGVVDMQDLLALLAAWGPNPGHPADLDHDGEVGVTDFLTVLSSWGPGP